MTTNTSLPESLLNDAMDLSDAVIYRIDRNGILRFLNPAGLAVLLMNRQLEPDTKWLAFIHEDDRRLMNETLVSLGKQTEDATNIECRLVGMNGAVIPCSHRIRPLRDNNGQPDGVIGIARDITALRLKEEQFQQSQKLETIGMLTGGIAHDFNNMLAAILGYTELMLEDKQPGSSDYLALEYIRKSTERAASLARQLLLFSRRSKTETKPVQLVSVLEETLQILRRTLPKSITIDLQEEEGTNQILGDRNRIQQALMNLCLNARDAMPNGGDLTISIKQTIQDIPSNDSRAKIPVGDYVHVMIKDTGIGMPKNVLSHIWEPFYTTKPSGIGTGLGLSVVQDIVKSHRGIIDVESQTGLGTTFHLYFPAVRETEIEETTYLTEPAGGSETILIVDDEPVLLDLLYEILHSKGYHVLAVGTGSEALEYVDELGNKLDMVITDNVMPVMTGRELVREIVRRLPNVAILVCSGFSPTSESEASEMDYVASYVHKPYQRREILFRVREALDARIKRMNSAIPKPSTESNSGAS